MSYDGPNPLVVNAGGTGRATLTNHGVLVGAGTTAITQLAAGSSGQVLQSGGASGDPAYSTATFPATATSTGVILRADGTNWVATTATYPATTSASQLLYSSSANVVGGLTTANNGTLVTSNSGVPSILAGGTAGQVLQSVSGAAPAWSTPTYPSASGSAGQILRSDGTNNVYTTSTYPNTNAVSTLLYASSANVMGALATGNSKLLTTDSSGVPSLSNTYISGTFTPTITGLSVAGTTTYTTQSGVYTRIGNLVFIQVQTQWSAATGTGVITLGALPYTVNSASGAGNYCPFTVYTNIAITTSTQYYGLAIYNTTTMGLYGVVGSTGGLVSSSLAANQANFLYITGWYYAV